MQYQLYTLIALLVIFKITMGSISIEIIFITRTDALIFTVEIVNKWAPK